MGFTFLSVLWGRPLDGRQGLLEPLPRLLVMLWVGTARGVCPLEAAYAEVEGPLAAASPQVQVARNL
jgi:hypothetical protein